MTTARSRPALGLGVDLAVAIDAGRSRIAETITASAVAPNSIVAHDISISSQTRSSESCSS